MSTRILYKIFDPSTKEYLVRIEYTRGDDENIEFFDCANSKLDDFAFIKKFYADRKGLILSKAKVLKAQSRLQKEAAKAVERTLVKHFGLQEDSKTIITPTKTIGEDDQRYIVPVELMKRYTKRGSLDGWQQLSAYLEMSSILTFSVCVGFAASLLKLFDRESCGFLISGTKKGGKSTTIRATAAIAGYGEKQRLKSFHFTEAGGEEEAQAHSGIAWPLDDLQMKGGSAKERHAAIEHFSYVLANGEGKVRARHAVASGIVSDSSWLTLCVAGAERTAASVARAAGTFREGGATARLIDIPCGMHIFDLVKDRDLNIPALCTAITRIGRENCGTPLNVFLKRFFKYKKKNETCVHQFEEEFVKYVSDEADDQAVQHVRQYFAFIYAVGALSCELGVLTISRKHVRKCIARCYEKAVGELDPERKFVTEGLKELRRYTKTLHRVCKSSPHISDDATGFLRRDNDRTFLIVSREYFSKMFPNAMQSQLVAKHLALKGFIRMPAPEHLSKSLDWASQQISWPTKSNAKKRVHSLVIEIEEN